MIQIKSDRRPLDKPAVARLAADTVRKAHAVGLVDEAPDFAGLTYATVQKVISRVREAGIGAYSAGSLDRTDPADTEAIVRELRRIEALIEESPLPDTEWPRLLEVVDRDGLAALLDVSASSVSRYERGERQTPDEVAARLHLLALVVGDLAGAYNALGIRRWFERPRTALGGRRPAELLTGDWRPEDEGPASVRALAAALMDAPAT